MGCTTSLLVSVLDSYHIRALVRYLTRLCAAITWSTSRTRRFCVSFKLITNEGLHLCIRAWFQISWQKIIEQSFWKKLNLFWQNQGSVFVCFVCFSIGQSVTLLWPVKLQCRATNHCSITNILTQRQTWIRSYYTTCSMGLRLFLEFWHIYSYI